MLKYLSVKIEVEQGGVHCDWHHQQTRQPWPCLAQTGPFWNWDWDRCAHCTRQISGTWKKMKKNHIVLGWDLGKAHIQFSVEKFHWFYFHTSALRFTQRQVRFYTRHISCLNKNKTLLTFWCGLGCAVEQWFLSASSKEVHFTFSNDTSRALETVVLSRGVN